MKKYLVYRNEPEQRYELSPLSFEEWLMFTKNVNFLESEDEFLHEFDEYSIWLESQGFSILEDFDFTHPYDNEPLVCGVDYWIEIEHHHE